MKKDSRYNVMLDQRIFLEKGEEFCSKCNGSGSLASRHKSYNGKSYKLTCPKCLGMGKLDWIEVIRGKKPVDPFIFWAAEAAKNLAKQIDDEIIKEITEEA